MLALSAALMFAGTASTHRDDPRAHFGSPPQLAQMDLATAPVTLAALAFSTRSDGWVLAARGSSDGAVLATRDAGASWSTEWSGPLVPIQIVATDPDHAWVLGQRCAAETCGSELIGTRDGGAHWSPVASLPVHIDQVAFESPSVGVAAARDVSCRDTATGPPPACPGRVLMTDDGGRDWRPVMKSAEPVVAVAAGAAGLWALDAAPGSYKPGIGAHPPSLVVFSSEDGGRAWTARGAVHPPMIAGLDVEARLVPGRNGRLWLSALDPESCAMHGCGLDGAWSSPDGGRHWRPLNLPDAFERGVGMPCGYTHAILGGLTIAVSFDLQDCAGPGAALYRLDGLRSRPIHVWRSFAPEALVWPSSSVGYALSQQSLQRSTDGGRRWRKVSFGS